MPKVLDNNIITTAVPDPATHTVALTWANGETTINSFGHLVGEGVFAAFTDPAFLVQTRVGEGGRSLEWPGELDFCVDALWLRRIPKMRPSNRSGQGIRRRSPRLRSSVTTPLNISCQPGGK